MTKSVSQSLSADWHSLIIEILKVRKLFWFIFMTVQSELVIKLLILWSYILFFYSDRKMNICPYKKYISVCMSVYFNNYIMKALKEAIEFPFLPLLSPLLLFHFYCLPLAPFPSFPINTLLPLSLSPCYHPKPRFYYISVWK